MNPLAGITKSQGLAKPNLLDFVTGILTIDGLYSYHIFSDDYLMHQSKALIKVTKGTADLMCSNFGLALKNMNRIEDDEVFNFVIWYRYPKENTWDKRAFEGVFRAMRPTYIAGELGREIELDYTNGYYGQLGVM